MAKQQQEMSSKRIAITNTNAQMVIIVAVASVITVFCLVASKAVLSQNQYNARVTTAKEAALDQLEKNLETYADLQTSYKAFNSTATNVIGGNTAGTGDNDGDNSKIVLDALPSTYDFPALTSSLEKIFRDRNLQVSSITGTDDQLAQQANKNSPNPQPIEIPFTITISNATYQTATQVIDVMQKSIRPISVDKLSIGGNNGSITVTIDAHTYYQPAKSVNVTKKVVK